MNTYLTEKQVAERLSLSVAALRRWRSVGFGPPWLKLGAAVRYAAGGLESWLANQANDHTP